MKNDIPFTTTTRLILYCRELLFTIVKCCLKNGMVFFLKIKNLDFVTMGRLFTKEQILDFSRRKGFKVDNSKFD